MIRFNRSTIPSTEAVLKSFAEVLSSGVITNNGSCVRQLEARLAELSGTKFALTTSNGTLGLQLAIHALGLKGEIITTPFTFIATTSSILWQNCTPVFADINPETLCIDPRSIESCITSRTVGILPVHIFGNPCDIDGIEEIASRHELPTIYDAAQAYGSLYRGRSCLSFGTLSVLSTHAYKVLSTIEGGVVFGNDAALQESLFRIRYFGKDRNNVEVEPGMNAKMNEFNAAYGLVSLEEVDNEIQMRTDLAADYMERLKDIQGLGFQITEKGGKPNHAYFPVLLPNESVVLKLIEMAGKRNVEIRRYFYPVLNSLPFIEASPEDTPMAADVASRIVCLPLYSGLNGADLDHITSILRELLN